MNPEAPDCAARRRFLLAGAALAVTANKTVFAAPTPVTVVTSYPDEFVSRIQAAFEKARPEFRMQVIWRMPGDAFDYLQQAGHGGADVYWSASPRTFARLAENGTWRKLGIDRSTLPARIGSTVLGDSDGYYTASEVAGFGFAISPPQLKARGLPTPSDWNDLADPRYAGLIAMPAPAQVGFAPPILEIVLQAQGWQRGWALWSAIAANATFIRRGSTFVTDEISSGRSAIGISIDFFVNSAIANGAPIEFIYPRHTGLNPAHVAITRNAPHPHAADAFVDFILSREGQRELAHPDIRRLPIRPDVYDALPRQTFNPFQAARQGGLDFDSERARPRLATTAAIFQQMLVEPQDELKSLWQRLLRAEAAGKETGEIRRLLGTPPVDEASANDTRLQRQIGPRFEGTADSGLSPTEIAWRDTCRDLRTQASQALEALGT